MVVIARSLDAMDRSEVVVALWLPRLSGCCGSLVIVAHSVVEVCSVIMAHSTAVPFRPVYS